MPETLNKKTSVSGLYCQVGLVSVLLAAGSDRHAYVAKLCTDTWHWGLASWIVGALVIEVRVQHRAGQAQRAQAGGAKALHVRARDRPQLRIEWVSSIQPLVDYSVGALQVRRVHMMALLAALGLQQAPSVNG